MDNFYYCKLCKTKFYYNIKNIKYKHIIEIIEGIANYSCNFCKIRSKYGKNIK